MKTKFKIISLTSLFFGFALLMTYLVQGHTISVFQTKGTIADKQRDLIIFAATLSLVVIVPVFTLLAYILWKYRATNTESRYTPDWDSNRTLESIWWGIPIILILILSSVTWTSTHALDPFKPLASDKKPMKIQVVALQWKWLFIYPEENIATVNYAQLPKDRPVDFEITADAPMNSFWVPQLGGQIYAMSGMSTHLNLKATQLGSFNGSSANISGEGFSGMKFVAQSTSQADFDQWVYGVKSSDATLDQYTYDNLSEPTKDVSPMYFGSSEQGLYDSIVMKFMMPESPAGTENISGHNNVPEMVDM